MMDNKVFDPSLAFVFDDEDGLNPFHFAISSGKTWTNGLSELATLVPDWPHRSTKFGLAPFQLAASLATDDSNAGTIGTIFELLRYIGIICLTFKS